MFSNRTCQKFSMVIIRTLPFPLGKSCRKQRKLRRLAASTTCTETAMVDRRAACTWFRRRLVDFAGLVTFTALDVHHKTPHTLGCAGSFPSGWNGNSKLQNYCDSLVIEETNKWYAWLVRAMCRLSGRPANSIQMIPCNCGPSPDKIKARVPGKCLAT